MNQWQREVVLGRVKELAKRMGYGWKMLSPEMRERMAESEGFRLVTAQADSVDVGKLRKEIVSAIYKIDFTSDMPRELHEDKED